LGRTDHRAAPGRPAQQPRGRRRVTTAEGR
jgi:hypothetical protein